MMVVLRIISFAAITSAVSVLGQNLPAASAGDTTQPVLLKRSAAPPAAAVPVNKYPFQALSQKLGASGGFAGTPVPLVAPPSEAVVRNTEGDVPATYVAKTDVALSQTASEAVAMSKRLIGETNSPAPSEDGRVIYTYGVGLPTVVCAPFRVCSLELQPGEKIAGEPEIGDTVRWEVKPVTSGTGNAEIAVLVIKPKLPGLDTTMIVTTDRRTYYVRLVSKPEEFVARTAFAYTDDEHIQWKLFLEEQQKEQREHKVATEIATTSTQAIDKLYFDYQIKPGKDSQEIRPDRVMDDGEKTYIQMPVTIAHRELPSLVIQGPSGNEMVNYRVKDNTFVVDRLFDRAALLMGSGKHQHIVRIERKQNLSGEVK